MVNIKGFMIAGMVAALCIGLFASFLGEGMSFYQIPTNDTIENFTAVYASIEAQRNSSTEFANQLNDRIAKSDASASVSSNVLFLGNVVYSAIKSVLSLIPMYTTMLGVAAVHLPIDNRVIDTLIALLIISIVVVIMKVAANRQDL